MNNKTKYDEGLEIIYDIHAPVPYVDTVNIGVRGDGMSVIRFATSLPEGRVEQARVFCSKKMLELVVDIISEEIGYYPEPKKGKKVKGKSKQ